MLNMPPLNRFADLVSNEHFDLALASLMLAEDVQPDIDLPAHMAQIEAMAATLRLRLADDAFAEQKLAALNYYLFEELGYRGNVENYYDPRNAYLHEVLARRTGMPITLGILYIELGRRVGLNLQGVAFPGHFLVSLRLRQAKLLLDPFAAGATQTLAALRQRLKLPADAKLDAHLIEATPRHMLVRLLRNLKTMHLKADAPTLALAAMQRLLLLVPESAEALRDRGLLYAQLDCFRPALSDLLNYLRRRPQAEDAGDIESRLAGLRKAVQSLH